jgi:parallel beta-helix repeat protein
MIRMRSLLVIAMIAVLLLTSTVCVLPMNGSAYVSRGAILINGNSGFTGANGVTGGAGTSANPWIIEGWQISDAISAIAILNTDKYFVIRGVSVSGGFCGIYFDDVANGRIESSIINGGLEAIWMDYSKNIVISDNIFFGGIFDSIGSYYSEQITLTSNSMEVGINIWGDEPAHYNSHAISGDNTINSYPIRYYKNTDNLVISSTPMGQLLLASCDNAVISNLQINGGGVGILNAFCQNNVITDCAVSGGWVGIELDYSLDCAVAGNNLSFNDEGIYCFASNKTIISMNDVYNNTEFGIGLESCSIDKIVGNEIIKNELGVQLIMSLDISICCNNFLSNVVQAEDDKGADNTWDAGPLTGGNHWSDYGGIDSDSNGIGDTPYVIDSNSEDRYPLMQPHPNAPPVARISVDDLTHNTSSLFVLFAGASTDLEDPARMLEVRWDWEKDGTWDTAWSYIQTATHKYSAEGNYTVCAEVRDSRGLSNKTSIVLSVDDTPPALTFLVAAGHVFTAPNVLISWNCSDNMSGTASMEYSLDGGAFTTTTNDSVTLQGLADGIHYIELRATDNAGNMVTENLTFEVNTNIFSPGGPMGPLPLIAIIAAIAAIVIVLFLIVRKKKKSAPVEPPPPDLVTPQPTVEQGPIEPLRGDKITIQRRVVKNNSPPDDAKPPTSIEELDEIK